MRQRGKKDESKGEKGNKSGQEKKGTVRERRA